MSNDLTSRKSLTASAHDSTSAKNQLNFEPGILIVDVEFIGDSNDVVQADPATEVDDEPISTLFASRTLSTVHRLASDLHSAGVFSKTTMRKFDSLCLTEVRPMDARDIKSLREEAGVSQAVLARVLNVTTSAVGQWERGEKRPTGAALKLLTLVREKGLASIV